ncbi:MAG: hypothetical protein KA099_04040 [Alphaproteobacteria bacterium]|nr:hypothetical protein [Alphaproteobacteria bacterium]MBP7904478.1 hypothetical protein [Alphaproteobacteria bacterium]
MKIALKIVSRTLLILAITVMPTLTFDQGGIPQAFAANEAKPSEASANSEKNALTPEEDAVLDKLQALLSENYCPNDNVKKWDFFEPAPSCLMEQAKRVAVAVFGPSEFSDQEEKRLRELVAIGKEFQAKLKEVGCKPGQNKDYSGPPPECLRREIEMSKEHARKYPVEGGGLSILQHHVLETKLRHLADMDRLHLLLAQMLSLYTCDTDKNTSEECVLNFYNSLKNKW